MVTNKVAGEARFNELLDQVIKRSVCLYVPDELQVPALHYLVPGGKRIRGLLILRILGMYGEQKIEDLLIRAAACLEFFHAASLIQDDLPCIDNDDFRRGVPTLHKLIPAGEALLMGNILYSMGLLEASNLSTLDSKYMELASKVLLKLNLGQILDLRGIESSRLKTGQLFGFAMYTAAVLLEKSSAERDKWFECGEILGIFFQCRDDFIDGISVSDQLESDAILRLQLLERDIGLPIYQIWQDLIESFDKKKVVGA